MIVRFARSGKSFKGVVTYLAHDAGHAETTGRVAWTHTINLAHDHLASAVHEMVSTCRDADLLKEAAGVAVATMVEKPVKHLSLNWHPSEKPEREAMIAAAESFVKHMGWQDHQAVFVAHDDRAHAHVHLVINAVHPETGRKLDDGFEFRRAQAWALGYEQACGKILCPERLKEPASREPTPPRPIWRQLQESTAREVEAEVARMNEPASADASRADRLERERMEWAELKTAQRDARVAFFAEGRDLYKAIARAAYREVREEMRPEWADYYAAVKAEQSPVGLAALRADLVERQAHLIEKRRSVDAAELRKARDQAYRDLLETQKAERRELVETQEAGVPFILREPEPEGGRPRRSAADALDRFGIRRGRGPDQPGAPEALRGPRTFEKQDSKEPAPSAPAAHSPGSSRMGPSPVGVAAGLTGGLLSLIGGLGEGLLGGHTRPEPRREDALDRFRVARGRASGLETADPAIERRRRETEEREAWDAWKERRDRDR